jgi:hypothetical protein
MVLKLWIGFQNFKVLSIQIYSMLEQNRICNPAMKFQLSPHVKINVFSVEAFHENFILLHLNPMLSHAVTA